MFIMKKIILSVLILISVFAFPLLSYASYIIHLKGGGQYITTKYWEEDDQIKFFVSGGTMGIDKDAVRKIEKSNLAPDEDDAMNKPEKVSPQVDRTPENTIKGNALPPGSAAKGGKESQKEKINIQDYKKKKDQMTVELEGLIEKVKEANSLKDNEAKQKAQEEMRKVSSEIYKLTDEVTEKNEGKLPEGWWEK
jgi:hypothetical protein